MTKPVIDSVSPAGPITANVGDKVTLTVVAHDPDARSTTLTIVATDPEGNDSLPSLVTLAWADGPITFAKSSTDDGTPVSVKGNVITVG